MKITHEKLLELVDYNPLTGVFKRKWECYSSVAPGTVMGSKNKGEYRVITLKGVKYSASHLAWFYIHRKWPKNIIDHINRIRDDNRIANLREATVSQNCRNRSNRSDNKTGVSGVQYKLGDKVYVSLIQINGNRRYLGCFKERWDAICARKSAELKLSFNF